ARADTQVEVEALAVLIDGVAKRNAGGCQALLKPCLGTLAQLSRLIERPCAIANGKARKNGLMRARTERAAPRNLHSRRNGFRDISKPFNHFRARLKA